VNPFPERALLLGLCWAGRAATTYVGCGSTPRRGRRVQLAASAGRSTWSPRSSTSNPTMLPW